VKKRLALTLLLSLPSAARADDWSPNLTLASTWNTNATNADASVDKIAALQTTADVVANKHYPIGTRDSLQPGLHASAEWWPRYAKLATGAFGARAEWQHKFGVGALAPVASVGLAGDLVTARENGRRGTAYGATLALRKKFNDTTRLTLSEELSRLDARAAVYDRSAALTTLELARDLDDVVRLTLAAFFRDGTINSYATPPRPDIVALAPHRLPADTFRHPLTVYSLNAHTAGAKAGLIRAIDDTTALILGYEYRRTERAPLRYVNHLVSLAFVRQF